jgi:NAD(P)H dehydrogenase (quinone)
MSVQVLVVYYSRTGNTKAMAEAVAEGAQRAGAQVKVKPVTETTLEDLLAADAIIVGSPTYYGSMAAEVKRLIDESVEIHGQLEGKVGGAFSSAGGLGGGQQTTVMEILTTMLVHGMILQGDPRGDHLGPVAIGAPDDRARAQCIRYGERLAALAERLHGR